jgi:signal transduction histidine kinase
MDHRESQALRETLARIDDALGDAVAIARRADPGAGRPLLLRALRDATAGLHRARELAGKAPETRGSTTTRAERALHDLRTPLTAIVGWIQLVRAKGFEKATTLQAFDTIERNATLLTNTLDRLAGEPPSERGQKGRGPFRLAG